MRLRQPRAEAPVRQRQAEEAGEADRLDAGIHALQCAAEHFGANIDAEGRLKQRPADAAMAGGPASVAASRRCWARSEASCKAASTLSSASGVAGAAWARTASAHPAAIRSA